MIGHGEIGHNSRVDRGPGYGGRLVAWRQARAQLISNRIPIEIIRHRVRRAAELGLDYKTYASIRAASGCDIVALLFSSNALRMMREARMPADRAALLGGVVAQRVVLTHAPLVPSEVAALPQIDIAAPAPRFSDSWSGMAQVLRAPLRAHRLSADAVVIIGDTAFEASWCAAARAAGYVAAEAYFRTG